MHLHWFVFTMALSCSWEIWYSLILASCKLIRTHPNIIRKTIFSTDPSSTPVGLSDISRDGYSNNSNSTSCVPFMHSKKTAHSCGLVHYENISFKHTLKLQYRRTQKSWSHVTQRKHRITITKPKAFVRIQTLTRISSAERNVISYGCRLLGE
jgi:hypothetical protein